MKRLFILLLLLAGCSSFPKQRAGIIHDYIFMTAENMCGGHSGLHYIIALETILAKESGGGYTNDYPCYGVYKIRCQDQTLLTLKSEVTHCFISESQLKESLE